MTSTLFRVMLRHLTRRPFQSIMFIIGVMIGVAMMVAIDMANFSATRAFELSTDSIAGRATHQILGGSNGIPESVYVQIRRDLGWHNAAPIVEDYVTVIEFDERPFRLLGVDPFAETPFRSYVATDNRTAIDTIAIGRFLVQPNTVIIGENLAQEYNIAVDDPLTVNYGDRTFNLTVVAVLRSDDELTHRALSGMIIADIGTAQEVLDKPGVLSRIDLLIDENENPTIIQQIRALLPPDASLEVPQVRREALSQITDSFQLNLAALSLLALVVGMFLIYNTVTFSVVQRRGILGTLRSLGVTRSQIFTLVVAEAALLSSIGAALGLILGVILGRGAVNVVTQSVNDLFFTTTVRTVEISFWSLVKGFTVGVTASVLAATVPAYEATNTPPAGTSRRSEIEHRTLQLLPYVTIIGILIALVGGGLLIIPNVIVSITALFMILIGLAFLTPLTTIYAMRFLRPLCGWLGGVVGRIAPQSIVRSLSRTSVAIAALMTATSMIVGVSVMVGSFRITVSDWLVSSLQADIFISPPARTFSEQTVALDPKLIDEISAVDGIKSVYYVRSVNLNSPDYELPVFTNAVAQDISSGGRKFIHLRSGYSTDDVWDAMLNGDGALVTESFAHARNIEWSENTVLRLTSPDGVREFPLLGIYQDFSTSQGAAIIGIQSYRQYWHDNSITSAAADIEPNADLDTVLADLKKALAGRELVIQSNAQLLTAALEIFDRTFAITTALNLLATIVAFVGILSALMSLQLERRREIGIMRSNGLTRRQLWRLTLWETGLMGTVAGALAMPTGLILAAVLTYIINQRSFGWSLSMNLRVEFFAQAFLVALIAALLAGLYPAYAMGRIMPAQALRSE